MMTRALALALTASLLVATGYSANRTPHSGRLKTVKGVITVKEFESSAARSMQKAGVSGLSVAILNDGKVVYTRQFGWKDKEAGTTLDDTTAFAAASLSKTVFAYLVIVLAEEGLIDLDKPIQH